MESFLNGSNNEVVNELRHLEGFKGGIAVSESEYMTTTLPEKQLLAQVFYSNALEVVEQAQYTLNTFWNKAMPAEQRIRQIEEGIMPDIIKTITDSDQVENVIFDMLNGADQEILVLFPTSDAARRQERTGVLSKLNEAAKRGVKIKILTPNDSLALQTIFQEICLSIMV